MNFPFFIARRLNSSGKADSSGSWRVMRLIATVSVTVSVAVMIVALSIVAGFRAELTSKIRGFAEDVTITLRSEQSPGMIEPFTLSAEEQSDLLATSGVEKIEPYSTANGLLQTDQGVEGIVFKGIGSDYDTRFLEQHLIRGQLPLYVDSLRSREVIISQSLAQKMGLDVGDVFKFIVVNENPRRDRFRVAAIYQSGLGEFDSKFVFADISTVNRINGWGEGVAEGYQLRTDGTIETAELIFENLPMGRWNVDTISDRYGQFFDWITMMELNTTFVLVIMLIVAAINMLCGVLIIILESVQMVGVLKTQGISGWKLQQIFLYRSGYIVLKGLFWGNLLGISLCLAQQYFGLISLDSAAYLLSSVPVKVEIGELLLVNIGSFVSILLLMMLPTLVVSKIEPAAGIKYL